MTHNERYTVDEIEWPQTSRIEKRTLIEIVLSVRSDKKRAQIKEQLRHYQNHPRAKYPLPKGDSFTNQVAADWVRKLHPEVTSILRFPKPLTGYIDAEYFHVDLDVDALSKNEIVAAYLQRTKQLEQSKAEVERLECILRKKIGTRGPISHETINRFLTILQKPAE